MIKTLTKHGNSYALIIDRPIMDLLKITPETQLDITTDGKGLTVRAVADDEDVGAARRRRLTESMAWVNQTYAPMLRDLAK